MKKNSLIVDLRDTFANFFKKTDIITNTNGWSSITSDEKVPSEKLVKDSLDNKIDKSQTNGLVKNDGSIDTNTYLTSHQDISGKANISDFTTITATVTYTDNTTETVEFYVVPSQN